MADLSDKVSESEEMSSRNPSPERFDGGDGGAHLKTCVDCGTSKTPLWRGGPAGPKSLCNACGIRSRKKRRALLGINNKEEKKPKKTFSNNSSTSSSKSSTIVINHSNNDCNSSSSGENNTSSAVKKYGEYSLKKKLMAFGRDFAMQRPRSKKSKSKSNASQRRKMGEVEQAAFLLMALSCGSVYA